MRCDPLVSVIITTHYRNDTLVRSIDSVKNQTYSPIEIIVVDDSGEDHARNIVEKYQVKYIGKDETGGQISAWNTGIEHSNGEFIQFLDDDDQLLPSKIQKQIELFKSGNGSGVVYCGMKWETGGMRIPTMKGNVLRETLSLDTSPCVTSTLLIKRSLLEEIKPIPMYTASTDNILKIELAQRTNFDYVAEPLVIRGESDDMISRSMKALEAMRQIMDDYDGLYNKYPPEVRDTALANIYYTKAMWYYNQDRFSGRGFLFLIYSIIKSPKTHCQRIEALFRSLRIKYSQALGKKVESIAESLF